MRSRSRTEERAASWAGGSEGVGTGVEADDRLLVAAARADPRAFGPLYRRYVSPIYRYCYLRLGDREAAEDATNDVFIKALAGLGGLRGGTFAAWLFRIAHNVVVDSYRRHRPSVPVESALELADPAPGVEAVALVRPDGSAAPQQIGLGGPVDVGRLAWAPLQDVLAVSNEKRLWLVWSDGETKLVTPANTTVTSFAWSPNGRGLA